MNLKNIFKFNSVIANEKINNHKLDSARKIISELQLELQLFTNKGSGPFLAAIYDSNGNLLVKSANSVVSDNCSNNHAEINAIRLAEEKLGTYDLSPFNLKLYITAEPCIMCTGSILWSGIKEVYYGVPTSSVEKITGFDEGFKPHWFKEFKKRGISVYGNIEVELGEKELLNYVNTSKNIYAPKR